MLAAVPVCGSPGVLPGDIWGQPTRQANSGQFFSRFKCRCAQPAEPAHMPREPPCLSVAGPAEESEKVLSKVFKHTSRQTRLHVERLDAMLKGTAHIAEVVIDQDDLARCDQAVQGTLDTWWRAGVEVLGHCAEVRQLAESVVEAPDVS